MILPALLAVALVRADDAVPAAPPAPPVDAAPMPATSTTEGGVPSGSPEGASGARERGGPPRPAGPPPVGPRFRVRPWAGASYLSPSGLDDFPASFENALLARWGSPTATRAHKGIRAALVQGVDVAYQVDRAVAVAVRAADLVSDRGTSELTASPPGVTVTSAWSVRTEMTMLLAGGIATLTLTDRTALNVSLFLGTGFARVLADEVVEHVNASGSVFLDGTAAAEAVGTAFIPEFGIELAHDLTDSLSAGLALGFRFGGVDVFTHRHATSLDLGAAGAADPAGGVVGDATGRHDLTANYRGPTLTVSFTGKF